MTTINEYLFSWEPQLKQLHELLLRWRYIRDMGIDRIPFYQGAGEVVSPEKLKEVAHVQIDLLQSALHNIEHEIMGIKCNCIRVEK